MQTESNHSMPRFFIIGSFAIALLLAAFSIASGSNPLVQPDRSNYARELKANPVSGEQLAGWIVEGRRDFQVVGFRSTEQCSAQKHITTMFRCYDRSRISDPFWVRRTFHNIDMPLIVYGADSEAGLAAAVELKHMGYKVRYLDAGFTGFIRTVMNTENSPLARYFASNDPLVKKQGQKWMVAKSKNGEEEEEEVELGDDQGTSEDEYIEEEGC